MAAALVLLPTVTLAATAGFVPSTGIWFSQTTFSAKDTVRLYTVIFNNEYQELNGTVAFYDNDKQIDTVAVKGLAKEQAEQIRVLWRPNEGRHVISARFVSAQAVDEEGRTLTITIDGNNSQPGLPLVIAPGVEIVPTASADVPGATSPMGEAAAAGSSLGSTVVNIEKRGNSLAMVAPKVLGEKIAVVTDDQPLTSSAIAPADDLFAKNRAALEAARGAIQTVTTTAATINKAYTATKDIVDQGRHVVSQGRQIYDQGKAALAKAKPVADKLAPWWNKLSKNNDPKRLLIIFGIALIVYLSLRWNRRRERYYDR